MVLRRSIALVFTLIGICGLAGGLPALAFGADSTTPPKSKKHQAETVMAPAPETMAQQYAAPAELNFDAVNRVLLKPDPVLPYVPQSQAKSPPAPKGKADPAEQPHLAPLLRESSLPESFGDRGSFLERHEFGIQLRDHF